MKAASELSPEFALLGLLKDHPMHGYELHQRLTADLGHVWRISQSQAYNILSRLERQGLIVGDTQSQDNRPARKVLHLTPTGSSSFQDWLRAPAGSSARAIRVEFITRLYFTAGDPVLTCELINRQIAVIQNGIARLKRELEALPSDQPFNRMSLDLRLRQLEPILEWLQDLQNNELRPSQQA